ncbi:hypothetical protein SMA01_4155 [Salmonella enterica subsp. enterica serovar Manhattan str. 111113]|nr:hypothetical protein SMA01_4155 [Salmonella enterica subsp. enterica serovar Manhattan str. 111113]
MERQPIRCSTLLPAMFHLRCTYKCFTKQGCSTCSTCSTAPGI